MCCSAPRGCTRRFASGQGLLEKPLGECIERLDPMLTRPKADLQAMETAQASPAQRVVDVFSGLQTRFETHSFAPRRSVTDWRTAGFSPRFHWTILVG